MSPVLKSLIMRYFFVSIIALLSLNAHGQCIVSKSAAGAKIITSAENYQYIRTSAGYYAVSIQTVLTKNNGNDAYTLNIIYTGDALHANLAEIVFKTGDGKILSKKINFVKTKKNDDLKMKTKVYKTTLTLTDITYLQQNDIDAIDMLFDSSAKTISIKVNNPSFLNNQLSCVAAAL
jgi:hypothetical protein